MVARLYRISKPVPMWQVRFADPAKCDAAGRPKRVRKHFLKKEEAENYLRALNKRLVVSGTIGAVFDEHQRADFFTARQVLEAAGFVGLKLADVARFYVGKVGSRFNARLVGELLEEFLRHKRDGENRAERAVKNLRVRVQAWLDRAGIALVSQITREECQALQLRKGVSGATRTNDMNAVSSFCTWCVQQGVLAENPLRTLRRPHVQRTRPAIWDVEEVRRVMGAAARLEEGRAVPELVLLVFAGLRPSELDAAKVILTGSPCVRVEGGKLRGRANRIVPLAENAVAWLRQFPVGKDGRVQRLTNRARQAIRDAAGVAWMADTPRHTFISMRLAVLPDEAKVAREAGNSPDIIFRHYHRLVSEAEARAFWGIGPKDCE